MNVVEISGKVAVLTGIVDDNDLSRRFQRISKDGVQAQLNLPEISANRDNNIDYWLVGCDGSIPPYIFGYPGSAVKGMITGGLRNHR